MLEIEFSEIKIFFPLKVSFHTSVETKRERECVRMYLTNMVHRNVDMQRSRKQKERERERERERGGRERERKRVREREEERGEELQYIERGEIETGRKREIDT